MIVPCVSGESLGAERQRSVNVPSRGRQTAWSYQATCGGGGRRAATADLRATRPATRNTERSAVRLKGVGAFETWLVRRDAIGDAVSQASQSGELAPA
jgi:hypothetical protein